MKKVTYNGAEYDLVGNTFGKLTVIKFGGRKNGKRFWHCRCKCGSYTESLHGNLISGNANSCGCSRGESLKKHGLRNHKLFTVWVNMRARCYNKNGSQYKDYGGRGIVVCKKWVNNFKAFYDWSIANGWEKSLTLDRRDNSKSYTPSNCRFTTRVQQNRNQRSNVLLTYNGKTLCISEWSELMGINRLTITSRLKRNWNIEETLTKKPYEIYHI